MIKQIELTPAEQELANQIVFDVLNHRMEYEQTMENGERAAGLMGMLIDRKAIPELPAAERNLASPTSKTTPAAPMKYFGTPSFSSICTISSMELTCRLF
jgi:hypothetical protein